LRHDHAKLSEQPSTLVNPSGPIRHFQASCAAHHQDCLLLLGLDRDEVHDGLTHGLADRLGIVLTALTVRNCQLRCHELDRVTERSTGSSRWV
jgi:hypothetical protein